MGCLLIRRFITPEWFLAKTTWPGAKGHVQTFAAADNGDMTDMDAYLCGSNSMIKAAVNYLTARCGLREDHIFMDNFGF